MTPELLNDQKEIPLMQSGIGVTLTNVGKRFNREWIFRHVNYEFLPGKKYAITGSNGSGKSTLLQVIAGALTHNEGTIDFNRPQPSTFNLEPSTNIAIAAPYLELIEEMTAKEFLQFHINFKPLILSFEEILKIVGLQNAANKQIRYYSSGMKQRLKLALAFFSKTPLLLLDEPTTNLDIEGINLYQYLINNFTENKLVIISSNDLQEFNFCDAVVKIGDFKHL